MVEDVVAREYARVRPTIAGFCGCDACRDDVLVFVLNRLRPHYVSQRKGEVLSTLDMGRDQSVADISIALVEAFRRVQAGPRAGVEHAAT